MKRHHYAATITWTGNQGTGTSHYKAYERSHTIRIANKPDLPASSDIPFLGDGTKHNPEDMLLSALSSCHMLWYLHLCADAGVVVTHYTDNATAVMNDTQGKGGYFAEVTLHPVVTVADAAMIDTAIALHDKAHECCFIANSVNFPVNHQPVAVVG